MAHGLKGQRPTRGPGAFAEPGTDAGTVAAALADELGLLAGWLDLGPVEVVDHGDLAGKLAKAVAAGGRNG